MYRLMIIGEVEKLGLRATAFPTNITKVCYHEELLNLQRK